MSRALGALKANTFRQIHAFKHITNVCQKHVLGDSFTTVTGQVGSLFNTNSTRLTTHVFTPKEFYSQIKHELVSEKMNVCIAENLISLD